MVWRGANPGSPDGPEKLGEGHRVDVGLTYLPFHRTGPADNVGHTVQLKIHGDREGRFRGEKAATNGAEIISITGGGP